MSSAPAYRYADAYRHPPASSIRALMPYAMRPGTVSMAGGYPAQELFDLGGLRDASAKVADRLGDYLQYSNIEGQANLRRELATLSAARGVHCDPDTELAVTGGSQQALSLLARVMLQAGDTAIVENAAYTNSIHALRYTGASVQTVPSGPSGSMDIDALEAMLAHVKPKMVCVVASFSNPTGATLDRAQRLRLIALAVKHEFLLVEDDPYGELRFEGEHVPPLAALADEQARPWMAYLSSLSKTVAPALRLGWLVAPAEIRRRCMAAKAADDMAASAWIQEIAAQYIADGHYERHVPRIVSAYGARCHALSDALTAELGDQVAFIKPEGGMFLWARLTGDIDASRLLPYAIEHEIVYVPGSVFYASPKDADTHAMRLSFATMDEARIRLGIARLRHALHACATQAPCAIVLP